MRAAALRYSSLVLVFAALICAAVVLRLGASASDELPRVELNADNIAPRQIEDLTSKSVPRDYALAWQTMEQALDQNRPDLVDGYFTGLERDTLKQRVKSQIASGLHARYTDRGHKLDAIFYAPAGDAMELRDRAQLDMQVLDGSKVIYEEPVNLEYIVIMTPGADRWLVRQLQAVHEQKP
jgi:lipopolysaccharide biosynthesis protein